MARKAIAHGQDGRRRKMALVDNGDGSFDVLVQCANYAGHVRGGIAYTWRGMIIRATREDATALFNRRNKPTRTAPIGGAAEGEPK